MTQDRTLHLYGLINADTIAPILSEIIRINDEDRITGKRIPIHLYINSGGGSMYDALTGVSAMDASKTPIFTHCHGYVMSAGLTLFSGGHKRFGGRHSQYMFHDPSEELGKDKLFVMENRLEELRRLRNIRTNYICGRTKLTEQDFENNRFVDYFMDAERALEKGIIHEIM